MSKKPKSMTPTLNTNGSLPYSNVHSLKQTQPSAAERYTSLSTNANAFMTWIRRELDHCCVKAKHRWRTAKRIGLDVDVTGLYCSAANTICSVPGPYV